MPIYEYECRTCGERFEALLFGNEKAACPTCEGADLEKQHSSFAVGGAPSAGSPPPGCPVPSGGG
jgi:putative FmdB family regulatory protein